MSELALKLIRENKRKHANGEDARALDLGNCGFKGTIPEDVMKELVGLEWLEELRFSNSYWDFDFAGNLKTTKNPGQHNLISMLPEGLKLLTGLKTLILEGPDITSFSFSDISVIRNLKRLTTLNLAYTSVKNIDAISELESLERLSLHSTQVEDITPLKGLSKLTRVNLVISKVSDLSPLLGLIKKGIPVNINERDGIRIDGCPLSLPPIEVASQGNEAILRYFAERDAQGTEKLYEAKLVLIGDGRAGKTTLRDKLNDRNAPLPPEDASTKGVQIDIAKYQFTGDHGQPFAVNVWDFAGQEKYQGIHQFFYTHRALYILVENSREQKTDFDYWLQTADLCSNCSPVIIVHNEFGDQNRGLFNLSEYQARYPAKEGPDGEKGKSFIRDAIRVNFATGRGLDELEKAIRYHIQRLPHVGEELPRIWAEIRTHLRDLAVKKPYIALDAFLDLCAERGIPEEDRALNLSRYLHILGAMLHYADNPLLSQFVILQNEWATDAVYRILDDEVITFETKGRFHQADLDRIWTRPDYARMKPQLLELMKKFKLCYQVREQDLYIAPQLLPATPPKGYRWSPDNDLRLTLRYEFMPKGLLTRFTVNRHTDIAEGQMLAWNSGVVLEWHGTRTEVTEQYRVNQGTIEIRVQGADKKGLLSIVDKTFDDLHADFQGIRVERLVPCNCSQCARSSSPNFYELSDLQRRQSKGQKTVECKVSYDNVGVDQLIENVFLTNAAERERLEIEAQARTYLDLSEIMPALDLLVKIHPEAIVLRGQLVEAKKMHNSNEIDGAAYLQITSKVTAGTLDLLKKK